MRIIDCIVSGLGVLLLSPLFLVIAVVIKLTSSGPVLHRAIRTGRDGMPFRLLKFRSMVVGADKFGPGITTSEDRRITWVGRFLRETKLDELPQLINVLRGQMSLVGPRPEDPRYVALYTPEHRQVLAVRPGITSLASLAYRDESSMLVGPDWEQVYIEQILPHKIAIELDYLKHRTSLTDLRILLRTLWVSVSKEQ